MVTISLRNIGLVIKKKRGGRGIREVASEIGISSATLSRIENGKLPDLDTFSKLCSWLEIDAGKVLGCSQGAEKPSASGNEISCHLKADKNLNPKTAGALAEMILAAQGMFEE